MFAFKKTQRLLTKADFSRVFDEATKLSTSSFIMLYKENKLGHARVGFAISKKAVAKSHDRNRIKRLLRESFRQTLLPAVDIVCLAKHGVLNQSNSQLNTQISKAWEKIQK